MKKYFSFIVSLVFLFLLSNYSYSEKINLNDALNKGLVSVSLIAKENGNKIELVIMRISDKSLILTLDKGELKFPVKFPKYSGDIILNVNKKSEINLTKKKRASITVEQGGEKIFKNGEVAFKYRADNKKYDTVKIGTQVWMKKNLDVDHYRNGDSIPEVRDAAKWPYLSDGWCYYDNDPANGEIYGKLYNWLAVNDPRGLAPIGWHIPTDSEWKELEMFLGLSQSEADDKGAKVWRGTDVGGKMKSLGTKEGGDGLWLSPNMGATNSSGFSAVPGGDRKFSGEFRDLGKFADWWSSSTDISLVWIRGLNCNRAEIARCGDYMANGFSVRCIKDKVCQEIK